VLGSHNDNKGLVFEGSAIKSTLLSIDAFVVVEADVGNEVVEPDNKGALIFILLALDDKFDEYNFAICTLLLLAFLFMLLLGIVELSEIGNLTCGVDNLNTGESHNIYSKLRFN